MMKRYMQGELAPDAPKAPIEPMAIDPNSYVTEPSKSGSEHVEDSLFKMADEKDY